MLKIETTARPTWIRRLAVATAAASTVGLLGAAVAQASADPTVECLWAGTGYTQGTTVTAGGADYTCAADRGRPRWQRTASTGTPIAVANPGSTEPPTGNFSAGAEQPGTEYNDYCVGAQLVHGSDTLYQAVPDATGTLQWKPAGPISRWTPAATRHPASTRSASLCPQDPVLWPEN